MGGIDWGLKLERGGGFSFLVHDFYFLFPSTSAYPYLRKNLLLGKQRRFLIDTVLALPPKSKHHIPSTSPTYQTTTSSPTPSSTFLPSKHHLLPNQNSRSVNQHEQTPFSPPQPTYKPHENKTASKKSLQKRFPLLNTHPNPPFQQLNSVGNRGVGNLRLIGLVGLGPASRVFTFHLLDSLRTTTPKISICPHMTSYSNKLNPSPHPTQPPHPTTNHQSRTETWLHGKNLLLLLLLIYIYILK